MEGTKQYEIGNKLLIIIIIIIIIIINFHMQDWIFTNAI